MNAARRAMRAMRQPITEAAHRIAVRYTATGGFFTAAQALTAVEWSLDRYQQVMGTGMPAPTRDDLLDALRQVDTAHLDIERAELRLMTHLKVRYGASWPEISEARGYTSRQAAQDRFKTLTARHSFTAQQYEEEARKAATRDQQEGGQPCP